MRYYIVLILFGAAAFVSYGLPREKYTSPDRLSRIAIPEQAGDWRSADVAHTLDTKDLRYNFISRVFARLYANRYGESLLFLILDAGNFHHPRVCFGASGADVLDLPDRVFQLGERRVKARCLYSRKPGESLLLVYWICIDGKITGWTGQKFSGVWQSLFNRSRTGFMVRLDIPCANRERIGNCLSLAQEFLKLIYERLPEEQRGYIFGK